MSRTKQKSLQGVSVPIEVLLPASWEESEGVTFTKDSEGWHGHQVRVLRRKELTDLDRLAKVAAAEPGWIDFLHSVKQLLTLKSPKDNPIIWQRIAPFVGGDRKSPAPPQLWAYRLPALATAFEDARLVFWYTKPNKQGKQELRPAIHCPDLKTASAARWLLTSEIRICRHCGKVFIAKHPKQAACSIECREASRIAIWRARRKKVAA